MQIDKKGMYWILKEFVKSGGNLHGGEAPTWSSQCNKFTAVNYRQWMHYFFHVEQLLESKPFKERGVGITTNAVCASVHFIVRDEPDDEEAMHQSVQALSLFSDDNQTNGNSDADTDEEEEMHP